MRVISSFRNKVGEQYSNTGTLFQRRPWIFRYHHSLSPCSSFSNENMENLKRHKVSFFLSKIYIRNLDIYEFMKYLLSTILNPLCYKIRVCRCSLSRHASLPPQVKKFWHLHLPQSQNLSHKNHQNYNHNGPYYLFKVTDPATEMMYVGTKQEDHEP